MKLYSILLVFSFSLVMLSCYLLLELNTDIVLIDLLFTEIQLTLGSALLFFFLAGSVTTFLLELITKLKKKGNLTE